MRLCSALLHASRLIHLCALCGTSRLVRTKTEPTPVHHSVARGDTRRPESCPVSTADLIPSFRGHTPTRRTPHHVSCGRHMAHLSYYLTPKCQYARTYFAIGRVIRVVLLIRRRHVILSLSTITSRPRLSGPPAMIPSSHG
ncbi:hypothetical protein BDY17DRAFT_83872 [Neohortaea acidophila]|uniref:Secreted protein n=1 Tax=Neohortaea acidophila TaxID=245834 RepID=A0A6A6Q2B7_9PEZI|nr:uncharacterized protein BDY17DRAFT_83872 [Neohortaea acidophila]KAF2486668.1 hypothetical protein BDY17DRAFT_83872 [Neohortaea acidophila]